MLLDEKAHLRLHQKHFIDLCVCETESVSFCLAWILWQIFKFYKEKKERKKKEKKQKQKNTDPGVCDQKTDWIQNAKRSRGWIHSEMKRET